MIDLDKVLEDSNDMNAKWTNFLAFPYSRAYANALTQFRETKGAQDQLNSQKAEFGIMALTICSAGILTHVFADTAWKAVAANKILNTLSKNNMNKVFNMANLVANNKAAQFVVGGLWDASSKILGDETKNLFTQNSASFPSTQAWSNETQALTSLMGFVLDCYLKYRETARSIFKNSKLTETERNDAISKLTSSRFAKAPSHQSVNEEKVAWEIELLFYLKIIMDLDYTQGFWSVDEQLGYATGLKSDIQAMPGTKDYPRFIDISKTNMVGQEIAYKDLGRAFYDRTNILYKNLYGRTLLDSKVWGEPFNATMNQRSFLAAYNAISTLEATGINRLKQSIL